MPFKPRYVPARNALELRIAGDAQRQSRALFKAATSTLAPSKYKSKSGRRAHKQDMRAFWNAHLQYNPEIH